MSDTPDAKPSEWSGFVVDDFRFDEFEPGARVLDVGCGHGEQVKALRRAGFDVVGVEPSPDLVAALTAEGLDVRRGVAEHLPVDAASFDGLVCKVVVPYTDERRAIAEWARVLRPGAQVRAIYHGAGYYARYLREGPGLPLRIYAARSLANTWWYVATGRRLPGFMGDTLYQSSRRLSRYYRRYGFTLQRVWPSRVYGRWPVFIYHELRYVGLPART